MLRSRRLHEAAWAYAELVRSERATAGVWLEYGSLLAKLEAQRGAVDAFDHAIELQRGLSTAWNERGLSLVALGRDPEALASFERASELQPRSAAPLANRAALALKQGEPELGRQLYARALECDSKHVVSRLGLGRSLALLGQSDDAERELELALSQAPMTFDVLLARVAHANTVGRLERAVACCERFLRVSPLHSGAYGLLLELRREQGDTEAAELLVVERWLQVTELGFGAELHEQLLAGVLDAPSLLHAPPQHATRNGRHTGPLSGLELEALRPIESAFEHALIDYTRAREGDLVFSRGRPTSVALHTWAVLLEGDGFQVPHLHPDAWLSGVYYAQVPAAPSADGVSRAGYLELGRVDPELGLKAPRPSHFVEPRPGRLVLFPSWLYHSTVPHRAPGLRFSIALDCHRV